MGFGISREKTQVTGRQNLRGDLHGDKEDFKFTKYP